MSTLAVLDPPTYPMAPSQAEWDAASPEARARILAALPPGITEEELSPPEGDWHLDGKLGPRSALTEYFSRTGRSAYIGVEQTVYYPAARRFAPDLFVVFDVETHKRTRWVVSHEGRGLDFVLEVHHGGDRKKDAVTNVERYARHGIPEYFVFDVGAKQVMGWRQTAPGGDRYAHILPQLGRVRSEVLGLDFCVEEGRLRLYHGSALLLETEELLERMRTAWSGIEARLEEERLRAAEAERRAAEEAQRAAEEAQRAAEEAQRADEEVRRREAAEQEVARLQAELKRLRDG